MKLPRPGASRLENLVSTLLINGNTPETLDLERIAQFNPWTSAEQLLVEFRLQQNGSRKLPEEKAAFAKKPIPTEEIEE